MLDLKSLEFKSIEELKETTPSIFTRERHGFGDID